MDKTASQDLSPASGSIPAAKQAEAPAPTRAQIKSAEDARRDAQIVSERSKANNEEAAKTARLRGLRLAKEAEGKAAKTTDAQHKKR